MASSSSCMMSLWFANTKLMECKKLWEALCILEGESENMEAKKLLQDLGLGQDMFTREALVMLFECDFKQTPQPLLDRLQTWSATLFSTLWVENSFNEVRRVASKNRAHKMDAVGMWHAVVKSFALIKVQLARCRP